MLRKIALASALLFAIGAVAYTAPFPTISQDVGVCDPNNPANCLAPGSGGGLTSAPYPWQAAGVSQSALSVTTSGVTTLTVPAGSLGARICSRGAINFFDDGLSTPTTGTGGTGTQINVQCIFEQGSTLLANFKAIAQTATTSIDVSYYK